MVELIPETLTALFGWGLNAVDLARGTTWLGVVDAIRPSQARSSESSPADNGSTDQLCGR